MELRLLVAVAPLVVERGPEGERASGVAAPGLQSTGSIAGAHGILVPQHMGSSGTRHQTKPMSPALALDS